MCEKCKEIDVQVARYELLLAKRLLGKLFWQRYWTS
jgi:hypothetical protein